MIAPFPCVLFIFFSPRFSVDKLDVEKSFSVSLSIELCIDDICDTAEVFKGFKVPIPFCNTDFTNFQLPGDGTIQGFVQELGENIGGAAVNIVVEKLGIAVSSVFFFLFLFILL